MRRELRHALIALVLSLVAATTAVFAQPYTVINTNDSGAGSLRQAITDANAHGGADVINFAIPGGGLHTISPASALPVITDAVTIDGTTQSGSVLNTNGFGQGLNTILTIEIDGTNAGSTCLKVAASNTTIRGLAINRCGTYDIWFASGAFTGNKVEGSFVGTNAAGTGVYPGKDFWAILIEQGSTFTIGGLPPEPRNLIGGNVRGIEIGDFANTGHFIQGNILGLTAAGNAPLNPSSGTFGISLRVLTGGLIAGNVISGLGTGLLLGNSLGASGVTGNSIFSNLIGTDATGTIPIGNNSYGIAAYAINGTIGGSGTFQANVIAGTRNGPGITIQGGTGTVIQANRIGTDFSGTIDLGNKVGVDVEASNCTIGGANPGEGNIIAFNGGLGPFPAGVGVVGGVLNTRIEGNRIFRNKRSTTTNGLGIDLGNDGVTPNDPCDADTGTQNYPVLTSATSTGGSTNIQGTLNSTANTSFRIEFFSNAFCDPTGYGEGQNYLGFTNVTTDGGCNATINATLPVGVTANYVLTATATDPSGNTSEFSKCLTLPSKFHTLTPCRVVDTRNANGPYGGPALIANADRTFVLAGQCGVPATASAVVLNIAVTGSTAGGDLRLIPAGAPLPLTSAINYKAGQTRADNAVILLGSNGDLTVHLDQPSGTVQVILDVDGYFE